MLRKRESRAATDRPVTHVVIYTLQLKTNKKSTSNSNLKMFALYMSHNSMSKTIIDQIQAHTSIL